MSGIVKNRIRELRNISKLTQDELALLMKIDVSLVSKHENHDRRLQEDHVENYAKVFKVSTLEIFHQLSDVVE